MIYLIFAIISVIISLGFAIKEGKESLSNKISNGIMAGITMFFVCVIASIILIVLLAGIADVNMEYENKTRIEYPIYGLEYKNINEQYSNGTFILGIGSYNSGWKENKNYYFFSVTEYGKKLETLNGNQWDVYIQETDDSKPCLMTIYQEQWYNDFFATLFGAKVRKEQDIGKILIVPTNTIQIDYNIDIQ